MTPLALIQGFLQRSHSAQRRHYCAFPANSRESLYLPNATVSGIKEAA